MTEAENSTQDTPWRHLETSAKVDVAMLVLFLATLIMLRGSDVLDALIAWFLLRAHLPWEWT